MDIYLQLESDSGYLHIMSDSDSLISEIDKHMSAAKCTAARYVPSYKDFLRRRQDYLAGVVKRACEERPPEPSGEAVRTDASPDEN
jgi:hypothetical protein